MRESRSPMSEETNIYIKYKTVKEHKLINKMSKLLYIY